MGRRIATRVERKQNEADEVERNLGVRSAPIQLRRALECVLVREENSI